MLWKEQECHQALPTFLFSAQNYCCFIWFWKWAIRSHISISAMLCGLEKAPGLPVKREKKLAATHLESNFRRNWAILMCCSQQEPTALNNSWVSFHVWVEPVENFPRKHFPAEDSNSSEAKLLTGQDMLGYFSNTFFSVHFEVVFNL